MRLSKKENDFKLKLKAEFVYGTSTKPSYFSGNLTDANIFRIKAEFNNSGNLNDFYIISNSLIRKYFFNSTFTVKSRDKKLKLFLEQNKKVNTIYDISYDSAEISPMIEADVKNNKVFIDINYQSFETNLNILDEMLQFCTFLKSYKND